MLQRGLPDSDPHHEIVAQLRDDSRSVIGVVSDLLDAVEVPTGSVTTPASLAGITESAVSSMSILARERGVHLVSRSPEDNLAIAMPAASLQRSLVALLDNAVKHSPAGAKVVVTARKEGAHAFIDVADEGPGIQGIAPSRIFDRLPGPRMRWMAVAPVVPGLVSASPSSRTPSPAMAVARRSQPPLRPEPRSRFGYRCSPAGGDSTRRQRKALGRTAIREVSRTVSTAVIVPDARIAASTPPAGNDPPQSATTLRKSRPRTPRATQRDQSSVSDRVRG